LEGESPGEPKKQTLSPRGGEGVIMNDPPSNSPLFKGGRGGSAKAVRIRTYVGATRRVAPTDLGRAGATQGAPPTRRMVFIFLSPLGGEGTGEGISPRRRTSFVWVLSGATRGSPPTSRMFFNLSNSAKAVRIQTKPACAGSWRASRKTKPSPPYKGERVRVRGLLIAMIPLWLPP